MPGGSRSIGSGGGFRTGLPVNAEALAAGAGTTAEVRAVSARAHPAVTMYLRDMSLSSTPVFPIRFSGREGIPYPWLMT